MKNGLLLLICISSIMLSSCRKDENKIYFEGGTPPTLTASTANVTLEPGLEGNTALVLNWTNPNYIFTTGVSSQDVTYTLEMDTAGANFTSDAKVSTVISKDLSLSYTVGQLNAKLGNEMQLQLNPRRPYTLLLRVISSIGSAAQLVSNVASFTTTPFAPPPKVDTPSTGHLYLVGDATQGGWNNPVPLPTQEFTKVSSTLYEITVPLVGSKHFLFLPLNGDWGNKYACHDGSTQPLDGGAFGYNGGNSFYNADIPGPADAANYKITVDFQLGLYKVVKQ